MKLANIISRNLPYIFFHSTNLMIPFSTAVSTTDKNLPRFNWKIFPILKQSLMAYVFNIFGIVAGTAFAYHVGVFQQFSWSFILYPSILSSRGIIGGLFCSRLSTGLHLGTMRPTFFRNTRSFYLLLRAIAVLTFEASVSMGLIAALPLWFNGASGVELLNILVVMMVTMALALAIISPLSMTVSFLSFKHGLDPDILSYPVESTVADLLITIIYISVLNVLTWIGIGFTVLLLTSFILPFLATYFSIRNYQEAEFRKTIRETFLTIFFVSLIISIAGSTLDKIAETVGEKREIYTVYPALIDTIGDVGAVVASTATTKLALGTLKPSFSSIKDHKAEISGAWIASLIMYCVYAALALNIQGIFSLPNFLSFTALLLVTNIIAASFIILISYIVAIVTYQRMLDPDNFSIPIESSLADSITSIALLIAIFLIG